MASGQLLASSPSEQLEQSESSITSEDSYEVMPTEWSVEAITAVRSIRDKRSFLVRWQGYNASDDTWEPEEHLANSKHLLDSFLERCNVEGFANVQCERPTPISAVLEEMMDGKFKVALIGGKIVVMTREELMRDHREKYCSFLEDIVITRF
jgi:hypothetical protein